MIVEFTTPGKLNRNRRYAGYFAATEDPMSMMEAMQQAEAIRELDFHAGTRRKEQAGFSARTVFWILATGACYYLATRIAWLLCFPDSKVSLFFPPHAVLISILLLVPTRQWWAYTLAAACSHYFATQQAHWPPLYALHCEVFDAVQNVLAAAGIRMFIKSPFHRITLREAINFVLIAVIIVPVGTAFWGAPSPSPIALELTTGSNGATLASRME
jgi:hypothetical protein